MNALFRRLLLACLLVGLSVPLSAQWPDHRKANAPRTADGKVDLNALPPKTADGKPDLSGVWQNVGRGQGQPAEALNHDQKPLATFRDIGSGFKGGLPLRPQAAGVLKERMANFSKDNPDVWCLPLGNQQFNVHSFPRKIIQNPDVTLILYETHMGLRQIFTDGRALPNNDPQPWWYGYSIGKWEGDTLVVETTGFKDGGWLDINGNPLTDGGKVTERFRRVNFGTLEIDVTVEDPKAYTKPFTVRVNQRVMLDSDLIEFVCLENQRFFPNER